MEALDRMVVQLVGEGLGLADLDTGQLSLQVVLQGISRDFKGIAVIIHTQQVTQPASKSQRNADQLGQVAVLRT